MDGAEVSIGVVSAMVVLGVFVVVAIAGWGGGLRVDDCKEMGVTNKESIPGIFNTNTSIILPFCCYAVCTLLLEVMEPAVDGEPQCSPKCYNRCSGSGL